MALRSFLFGMGGKVLGGVYPRRLIPAGDQSAGQTLCSCFFLFDDVLNFWGQHSHPNRALLCTFM